MIIEFISITALILSFTTFILGALAISRSEKDLILQIREINREVRWLRSERHADNLNKHKLENDIFYLKNINLILTAQKQLNADSHEFHSDSENCEVCFIKDNKVINSFNIKSLEEITSLLNNLSSKD